jgi:hypothetical protein
MPTPIFMKLEIRWESEGFVEKVGFDRDLGHGHGAFEGTEPLQFSGAARADG